MLETGRRVVIRQPSERQGFIQMPQKNRRIRRGRYSDDRLRAASDKMVRPNGAEGYPRADKFQNRLDRTNT